ncbi:hypothetical protein QBC32DRAFT_401403 [Pseudoneurospora amorphoporcata]|uniref:Archaemetzincin-2 n=1 Tax=Pseudoneurospora amorphoporcata TaxID=241081 RepID=A0AAN6SBN3_9PEZI|nr:hypothetical protein QBC32DRAFT_401403 [Pseudoneurospora amorphoporcata]
MSRQCRHDVLQVDVSRYAKEAGCSRPSEEQRQAAATTKRSGRPYNQAEDKDASTISPYTFPAQLTLPDDLLALGDHEPPQSMLSWIRLRTPVTQARKTIYVVRTPSVDERVSFMQPWTVPTTTTSRKLKTVEPPRMADVSAYLEAFYYPLPVKTLPHEIGDGVTRVRTRPCPDAVFGGQLNLNDLLDGALHVLPDDAYAILLLVDHDLYEDDEDDFCCGRAYGGSRICIVSSSRYHPALDTLDYYVAGGIDLAHMWPASHCQAFVEDVCSLHDPRPQSKKRKRTKKKPESKAPADDVPPGLDVPSTPMGAALRAVQPLSDSAKDLHGLWFSRVARTVSHEIGHCFCLGHYSYYACVMQGTTSVAEDVRQPPYLCPVCLAKVTHALMAVSPDTGDTEQAYAVQRYQALMEFCQSWLHVSMFAGFRAWLEKRVQVLSAGHTASSPICLD